MAIVPLQPLPLCNNTFTAAKVDIEKLFTASKAQPVPPTGIQYVTGLALATEVDVPLKGATVSVTLAEVLQVPLVTVTVYGVVAVTLLAVTVLNVVEFKNVPGDHK